MLEEFWFDSGDFLFGVAKQSEIVNVGGNESSIWSFMVDEYAQIWVGDFEIHFDENAFQFFVPGVTQLF